MSNGVQGLLFKLGVAVLKEKDGNDTQQPKTLNQAFARRERPRSCFLLSDLDDGMFQCLEGA